MMDLSKKEAKMLNMILVSFNLLLLQFYIGQFSLVKDLSVLSVYLVFFFIMSTGIVFLLKKQWNKSFVLFLALTISLFSVAMIIRFGRTSIQVNEIYSVQRYEYVHAFSRLNSHFRKVELVSENNPEDVLFLNNSFKLEHSFKKGDYVNLVYTKSYFPWLEIIVAVNPIKNYNE